MTKKGVICILDRLIKREVITKIKGGGRGRPNSFRFCDERVTQGDPLDGKKGNRDGVQKGLP